MDNPYRGEDGIDLYNNTYFTDIHPTITTRISADNNKFIMGKKENERDYRIRKLTPKECFRLMGVADTDSDKMMDVLSKSRCYQVAGNSIVVDVLAAIFDQLFNGNKNINQQTELF